MKRFPCRCPACGSPGVLSLEKKSGALGACHTAIQKSDGSIEPDWNQAAWDPPGPDQLQALTFHCDDPDCLRETPVPEWEAHAKQILEDLAAADNAPAKLARQEEEIRGQSIYQLLAFMTRENLPINVKALAMLCIEERDYVKPLLGRQIFEDLARFLMLFPDLGIPWKHRKGEPHGLELEWRSGNPVADPHAPKIRFEGDGKVRLLAPETRDLMSVNEAIARLKQTGWNRERLHEGPAG